MNATLQLALSDVTDQELAQVFHDAAWACELEDGTDLCCYLAGVRAVRARMEAAVVKP